jgi:hypothetical protein
LDAPKASHSKSKNLCVCAFNVTNGQPWLDEQVMLKVLLSDSMNLVNEPNKKRYHSYRSFFIADYEVGSNCIPFYDAT